MDNQFHHGHAPRIGKEEENLMTVHLGGGRGMWQFASFWSPKPPLMDKRNLISIYFVPSTTLGIICLCYPFVLNAVGPSYLHYETEHVLYPAHVPIEVNSCSSLFQFAICMFLLRSIMFFPISICWFAGCELQFVGS